MPHLLIFGHFVLLFIAATAAADDTPAFKITTKNHIDRIEVKVENDKTIFSIRSPSGIGHALIERTGQKWPDAVELRLHLKGLESFQVTSGNVKLDAAVSSANGKVRLWKDGKEDALLDAKNPWWMSIRIVGGDGKPAKATLSDGGYFEMLLPQALFEGNPQAITVNWIDFFRN